MVAALNFPTNDSLLDFLVRKATPEEILAYRASDDDQQRADELTEKNKTGNLTVEEQKELQDMLASDAFVAALKTRALEILSQS